MYSGVQAQDTQAALQQAEASAAGLRSQLDAAQTSRAQAVQLSELRGVEVKALQVQLRVRPEHRHPPTASPLTYLTLINLICIGVAMGPGAGAGLGRICSGQMTVI